MSAHKPPRYQGKITSWKDEQGFGFITPNGGGPEVFLHIKSFNGHGGRPAGGETVTYALFTTDKGQPRAENVSFVRRKGMRPSIATAWTVAVLFLAFVGACVLAGQLPPQVLYAYLGLSMLAFLVYAHDKSAARNGRWRTEESVLHLLGLVGGWPGALVARQVLRHKSKKLAFRTGFWTTVILNIAALAWLLSPMGAELLAMMGVPRVN